MAKSRVGAWFAIAAAVAGCKTEPAPRGGHLGELSGTVLEVDLRNELLVARLDARGCPPVDASARADANGVAMERADDADAGFGFEARGCSGRWTLAAKAVAKGDVIVTIADASGKLVVETLPLTGKAGFKLVSPPSLTAARAGEEVVAEAHGFGASKLVRAEVVVTTRRGDKSKLPATDVTVGGSKVAFTLPRVSSSDGGVDASSGELTVSAEADAVVRCEGAVRCVAPMRATTSFALSIKPASGEK